MTDYDRGPYTPPSDRLAFERREPVRSGGPAPVTLIVSGVILAAIIGGVVALYHGGTRHRGEPPAEVGQPVGSADASGAPPAQLTVDRSDNALAVAPPAAATNSAPLAALAGPAPPPPVVTPGPAAAVPAATTAAATPAVRPATGPAPIRTAAMAPPAPAATPATPPARPLTIASLADAAVANHSTPLRPALHPAALAPAAAAFTAQIGAFTSSALADRDWTEIAALDPHDMAGKHKLVQSAAVSGHTWYRTIVSGFASEAAARAFCDKLVAAHKPCIAH